MKFSKVVLTICCVALLAVGTLVAEEKVDLSTIKCVVSGKAINPDASADYKDASVYFCCNGCPKAFAKNTEKFAAKANHQLVATKQAKQTACPFSGKGVNEAKTVEVGDISVAFCCGNCQKKVASEEGDAQVNLVFNDKAFDKGFEVVTK